MQGLEVVLLLLQFDIVDGFGVGRWIHLLDRRWFGGLGNREGHHLFQIVAVTEDTAGPQLDLNRRSDGEIFKK